MGVLWQGEILLGLRKQAPHSLWGNFGAALFQGKPCTLPCGAMAACYSDLHQKKTWAIKHELLIHITFCVFKKGIHTYSAYSNPNLISAWFPLSSADEVLLKPTGAQLTVEFLEERSFSVPVMVLRRDGLGMNLPPSSFGVNDVEHYIGKPPSYLIPFLPLGHAALFKNLFNKVHLYYWHFSQLFKSNFFLTEQNLCWMCNLLKEHYATFRRI